MSDAPLVYVGLGTVMNRRSGVLETIVEGLRDFEGRVIVTTGPDRDLSSLGKLPASFYVRPYLRLTELLPRCGLTICHAGWNTVISLLTHGVPLICVPLGADGFVTAERYVAAGVGARIDEVGLHPQHVRDAAAEVLDNPTYSHAAQQFGVEVDAMPPARRVVEEICDLVNLR